MDILVVIIVLLMVLFGATWSAARSYFLKGRLAGMQDPRFLLLPLLLC